MALNNETIVEKDLVAWVMLGIVHVPRSEVIILLLPMVKCITTVPCHQFAFTRYFIFKLELEFCKWVVPSARGDTLGFRVF